MIREVIVVGILMMFLIDGKYAYCSSSPSVTPISTFSLPKNTSFHADASGPAFAINQNAIIPSDKYPTPRRDESVQDTYPKNTVVKDPYRWMENPDCPETKKFIEEQMAITKPYLEKAPFRAELKARYKELWNFPKFSGFLQKGKKYFSFQNTGLQNQDVVYIHDSLADKGKVFLDTNGLGKDDTVALDDFVISEDGLIAAYSTSEGGTDWKTVQFKHIEEGEIYEEKLTKIKHTSLAWSHDNKGIFYSGYLDQKVKTDGTANDVNENQKLYYHVVGTEQSKDVMVAEFPDDPDKFVYGHVSDDGKYLIVMVSKGCQNNMVYLAEIGTEIKGKLDLLPVATKMDFNYFYLTNTDKLFVFQTNKDADNYKLVTVDIGNPVSHLWIDLVPEDKKNVLEWASSAFEKYMILCYTENVKSVLQLHELASGKMVKKFNLEIGTVSSSSFYSNKKLKDIFFDFQSFLTPGITYHCDLSKPSFDLEIVKETKLKNFDREKFITEQVTYKSKDGTEVPMYIVHKKTLKKDGNNLAFMWAYGGFAYSILPFFSISRIVIMHNFDGVHAVPNIRGGGEKGEKWHRDGQLDKKQNSFDDFQAGAEYLIAQKYTNSKLLAINGGSNGGLLMGACLNQRPDLFGAVIADVGVMDMLRYDKFTVGRAWITEYGSSSNETDFQYLIKYSPLHNVRIPESPDKQYPATMLTTSDHDDRVSPLHSLKFIATLQYEAKKHSNQKNPFIIRVETDAGHGCGTPTDKRIAEIVDMMCFIVLNTGVKFHS